MASIHHQPAPQCAPGAVARPGTAFPLLRRVFGFLLPARRHGTVPALVPPAPLRLDEGNEATDTDSLEELLTACRAAAWAGDHKAAARHLFAAGERFGWPAVDRLIEDQIAAQAAPVSRDHNNKDTPR